jgi:TolB-like protein
VGPPATAPTSLAVLYFENASADTGDAYLADGITEESISRLGQVGRIQVKSRYLVRRYRGDTDQDPAAIGRTLGVSSIVTGSVRRGGNRVRVTAEMVRTATGNVVWS